MSLEQQVIVSTYSGSKLKLIAAILFLIQMLLFFLYYNFVVDVYVLGIGWILLIPGLILVILSVRDQEIQTDKSSSRNKSIRLTGYYPMHLGWSIVSISLALIIQQWFTYFIAIGFICIMILDIRRELTS